MNPTGPETSPFAGTVSPDAAQCALGAALAAEAGEVSGARLGNYQLLQKIGEGGFGDVWLAEQREPIRRRVALKVIKLGMDTEEVIARFEAERQALALMDHANIARVFDAGSTSAGRPYFVMELVRGVSITRYCDEHRVPAEERLRLFAAVCHAVQHAHQKGVIHRDLKPSNILVTLHDGVPVPKIIDFGIAKATGRELTEQTLFTQFHAFIGTPAYTSPEQMEMSGLDVDTRSDIYSLGVLLYELLTGRPPFDPTSLLKSGLEAMRRTIREVEPPRPSTRLRTLPATDRDTIAQQRSTDATRLSLMLRGDLDWIVMRCLEKDRTRRYESAAALADEVARHLRHEPVLARPAGAVYRGRKFVRRHRLGVAASAAILFCLVGGLVAAGVLLEREHAAHQRTLIAEHREKAMRMKAEHDRTTEARRASRASLALSEQLFRDNDGCAALAHLVRAARSDPANTAIAPRLLSALAYRDYYVPVGRPLRHSADVSRAVSVGSNQVWVRAGEQLVRWDVNRGTVLQSLTMGSYFTESFSADRELLATRGGNGDIDIVELASGRIRRHFEVPQSFGVPFSSDFAFDDRWLITAGAGPVVAIWDAASGERCAVLPHAVALQRTALSPDRTLLCTVVQGEWRTWRVPSGEPVASAAAEGARFAFAGFSPDGRTLAVTDNLGTQLYDPLTAAKIGAKLQRSGGEERGVWFSHDGTRLAAVDADGGVQLWDNPPTRRLGAVLVHPGTIVHTGGFTTDDQHLLTNCADGMIRVWDTRTHRLAAEPVRGRLVGNTDDARRFLRSSGPAVWQMRRWEGARPLDLSRLVVHATVGIRLIHGTTHAWAVFPTRLQRFDLLTGELIEPPCALPAPVVRFDLSPNARFAVVKLARAAGANQADYEIWDLQSAAIRRSPLRPVSLEVNFRFSSDSNYVLAIDTVRESTEVWQTVTGAHVLGPLDSTGAWISWSPDVQRLALTIGASAWRAGTGVDVYELPSGRLVRKLPCQRVDSIAFVSNTRLAVVTWAGMQLWDAETGAQVAESLAPAGGRLVRLLAGHGSTRVLTVSQHAVQLWDMRAQLPLTPPIAAGRNLREAGLAADDSRIVTWSLGDAAIRVWDVPSGAAVGESLLPELGGISAVVNFQLGDRMVRSAHWTQPPRSLLHAAPPATRPEPLPGWLARLATLVAGGVIDDQGAYQSREPEPDELEAIRREVGGLPDDAPYADWGRWLVADPATRAIAPGFKLTRADAERLAMQLAEVATP